MPPQATDRQRIALAVIAVVSVSLAALSFRALNAASLTATKQVPTADLRSLTAYLAPLPDTTSLAIGALGSMVGEPDPFGAGPPAVRVSATNQTQQGTVSGTPQAKWVVSSILFEDSKRSAIVNDAWVDVGEMLPGGARLEAIERKYVVVADSRGKRQVVPLQVRP